MKDKLFKNKEGRYTLFQKPNLPLAVWFVSWILSHILPYGQLNFIAALIAFGSLFTWAWLEVFDGDSLFRRVLGGIILLLLVHSHI